MKDKLSNPKFLAQLALLVAVELVMKITGLGSVPIGPIYMSFLTLPVAIGAILMGPLAGAILGGVFGKLYRCCFRRICNGRSFISSRTI